MDNIKFIIFLSEDNMKKRPILCGKRYIHRLMNKGIFAINYHGWKQYFIDHNLLIPTFDINENAPTMGVVYKKFTDNKYLSLENYDSYLFREQCRSLSTLVSYLGASSIKVNQKIIDLKDLGIEVKVSVAEEVEAGGAYDKSDVSSNNLIGIKEFNETVESYITLGGKKFDKCASEGGLYGVDKDIYKRLYFVNIVSERFNGQKKSFFTIHKKINSKEILEIGAYIRRLNIGLKMNYNEKREHEETYTFVIEYHDLDKVLKIATDKMLNDKEERKRHKKEKMEKRVERRNIFNKTIKKLNGSSLELAYENTDSNEIDNEIKTSVVDTNYDPYSDSDSEDEFDLELLQIHGKHKISKNEPMFKENLRQFIVKYAEHLGIADKFHIWISSPKNSSIYNARCKWFKDICDIDYFFRDAGIL